MEGTITDDGRVLCTCGKRCGGLEEGKVSFACACGNVVTLDSDLMFMRTCDNAIKHIAATTADSHTRIAEILQLMADKKKSFA